MQIDLYTPVITKNETKLPLYICTIGSSSPEGNIYRPDGICDFQLLYTASGTGKVKYKKGIFDVPVNHIAFFKPYTQHLYKPANGNWTTYWITYNGRAAQNIFDLKNGIYPVADSFNYKNEFEKIFKTNNRGVMAPRSSTMLYEFLINLKEAVINDGIITDKIKKQINTVLDFITNEYKTVITLDQLSEIMQVSNEHFCRIFKEYTGMRPFEYINNVRIKKAKENITVNPDIPLNEIAVQNGFQSEAYFSQVFKKIEGISPNVYKKFYIH